MAEAHTYESLHKMTVAELRQVCEGFENQEAVQGYTQLNKEHLLPLLCKALGIEAHVHHAAEGVDKARMKAEIRTLKKSRDTAMQSGDSAGHREARLKIRKLKRQLRRAVV
jgi:hypothetical protein